MKVRRVETSESDDVMPQSAVPVLAVCGQPRPSHWLQRASFCGPHPNLFTVGTFAAGETHSCLNEKIFHRDVLRPKDG